MGYRDVRGYGSVEVVPREEFISRRWAYTPGEHVSWLGPTGSGKTTFALQLLAATATRDLPAVVMVIKPTDETVTGWQRRLGYRRLRHWPPAAVPFVAPPPGWVLWPKHSYDPDADDARLHGECRKAILDSYKRGRRILFADEAWGLADELGLARELVTVWTRGRSKRTGLWAGTQKPSHVPLHMYNQASHLFLAFDPDARARQRFGEIGGVDPKLVQAIVMDLPQFEWLYLRRRDRTLCVVGS